MRLFIAHVGFYDSSIGIYELHTNFFVVAHDAKEAKSKIKDKEIFKEKNMHIDALSEIDIVDGYNIQLVRSTEEKENKNYTYNEVKNLHN